MKPKYSLIADDGTIVADVSRLNVPSGSIDANGEIDLSGLSIFGITATAAEINRFDDVTAYQESITGGAISINKIYSGLTMDGGGAVTLAAPDGTMLGQLKTIEMTTADGDVTLALTNVVGQSSGTTATFNSVGDALVLLALFDKWLVIKEYGIALA